MFRPDREKPSPRVRPKRAVLDSVDTRVATAYRWRTLYSAVRNLYQRSLNRPYWRLRATRRAMYAQLVPSGCLVFDVGAHRGDYAEMFVELGCRVVAFEPQPQLARMIGRHYPKVTVEQSAVGAAAGVVALRVGHDTQHSTAAAERIASDPARFGDALTTPVLTLDRAAELHGIPEYVKIDVEGYEQLVLAGMSFAPAGLSFEYIRADPDSAIACVRRLGELGRFEFTFETDRWQLGDWRPMIDPAQLTRESGDVFARRR